MGNDQIYKTELGKEILIISVYERQGQESFESSPA